jgi:cobalt-zinc-cadmium efflux system membrane fusion protein
MSMKKLFLFLLAATPLFALSHEGEDHGEKKAALPTGAKYFSSEALSDKYEVLVKYGELQGGKPSTLQIFLSNAKTNKAIDSATITIKVVGQPNLTFKVSRADTGVYQLSGAFPANQAYDLQVNINSPLGPDFLQVPKIEVGKTLTVAAEEEHSHWYESPWLWAAAGIVLGLLLMYFLMRNRYRKVAAATIILGLLIPTAGMNPTSAHGGEDHGGGTVKSGGMSSSVLVEKESQFLFDILTQPVGVGTSFYESTELLGTVTASPQGSAVIQSPQTGKIVSLRVTPGQNIAKGQTLAVIEQQVDAGTQINVVSERNRLNAELQAAKAQYERLQTIADIAAKKDVIEAKARYDAAAQNYRLFNANVGGSGSTKLVTLTAPISGVVGTFNYAMGAVVSAGQTLFDITNLSQVYIETQVFAADNDKANRFEAFANNDTARYSLRLVSTAQSVNTENQAQRVVFEVISPKGAFKIGENVRVLRYGSNRIAGLVIPTSAVVDINGKPAVFVKDKAEQFSLAFIQKGNSNPVYTAVSQGIEAGEKIVTGNVYQMKMIYLGQ